MSYYLQDFYTGSLAQDIIESRKRSEKALHNFSYSPKLQKIPTISIYNNSLKISNGSKKVCNSKPPIRSTGDIKNFSNDARRRFITKLSHINLQLYAKPIFVTLTYHKVLPKNNKVLKEQLDKFLQFLRNYTSNFEYVWRLEFQQRGAPHFHLILFPKKGYDNKLYLKWKRDIPAFWRKTVGEWNRHMQNYAVDIQKTDGKRNVFFYLSKYAAKQSDITVNDYRGRYYGFSSNIVLQPLIKFEITFQDFDKLRSIIFNFIKSKYKMSEQFENYLLFDPTIEILISLDNMKFIIDTFQQLKYNAMDSAFFDKFNNLDFAT